MEPLQNNDPLESRIVLQAHEAQEGIQFLLNQPALNAMEPTRPGPADQFSLTGVMESVLHKADGSALYVRKRNLITNAGFDFIADVIGKNSQPGDMTHIAIGTAATAAAATQTALVSEEARGTASYSHSAGTKVFTFETTFNPGDGTGALAESGVFNAASGGIMLNRVVFSVLNKGASDSLTQRFTFTLA